MINITNGNNIHIISKISTPFSETGDEIYGGNKCGGDGELHGINSQHVILLQN